MKFYSNKIVFLFFFLCVSNLSACNKNEETIDEKDIIENEDSINNEDEKEDDILLKTFNVEHNDTHLSYQGRIGKNNNDSASEIYWSGSSIKVNFKGTSIKVDLQDQNGTNYFNIILDGEFKKVLKLDKGRHTYTLFEKLKKEQHSLEITKRNEWTYGKTLFYKFEIVACEILDADAEKKVSFEFYGDSITAGHGNEDYSGNDKPEGNVTNNYKTYAAVTARHFDADYTCIARGGIGIMVSWFDMIMPEMYYRLDPSNPNSRWDFSKKEPTIVFVNLFQNDSWIVNSPNNAQFKRRFGTEKPSDEKIIDAYASFLQTIRDKYTNSKIICVLGNMDITRSGSKWPGYVENAITKMNDSKIETCFVPYKNTKGHPKVEEHQKIADKLIQLIEDKKLLED